MWTIHVDIMYVDLVQWIVETQDVHRIEIVAIGDRAQDSIVFYWDYFHRFSSWSVCVMTQMT